MVAEQATATFNAEALRRGFEERDEETLNSLYLDDAECVLIDRTNPPSSPRVMKGREAIAEYNRDLLGRDATHRVESIVVSGDSAAFADACRYTADGVRVYCAAMLDLRDGKIARQVCVQVWDE